MAAGDVTINGRSGRSIRGIEVVSGTVVLDGSNPTPIAFSKPVLGGIVSFRAAAALALDPSSVSCSPSGNTLNVYAWKVTGQGDTTSIASTNNTAVVDFVAILKA